MADPPLTEIFSPLSHHRFSFYTSEESNDVHKRFLRDIHTSQIFNGMNGRVEELLVEFCVQCNLPDLLVSCDIKTSLQSPAWLKLYSQYQDLKNDHDLKKSLLAAIDYSADYFKMSKFDSKWISLVPILLSKKTLFETTNPSILNKEDIEIQVALTHHPNLMSLFTSISEDQKPVDLSLHQLLKEKFVYQTLKEQSLCRY